MEWFLEQAERQLTSGLAAHDAERLSDARFHYLKAAEYLFKAAQGSQGRLRSARTEMAERLLARARALPGERSPKKSKQGKKPIPASDGDQESAPWLVTERPGVTFDDVAGLEKVKEQVYLRLVYPYRHPDLAQHYGTQTGGGLLLYGPPGTGKTLLARAVAGEIDAAFFSVHASDIMSRWVGDAEQNVAALFHAAQAYDRSVIFVDEIDALMPKRRSTNSSVVPRVVNQFLTELQGFHGRNTGLLFIGATNEPWSLDTAALRPGRLDERVYVPLPDRAARERILEMNLAGRPLADDVDLEALAQQMNGYSGADLVNVCRKACDLPFLEAVKTGQERRVEWGDFRDVMREVRPSVPPKEVTRFERFAFGEECP